MIKNYYPNPNTPAALAKVLIPALLLLTTQQQTVVTVLGEAIPKAKEYTLADFGKDSVEPGCTLLSESYAPATFPVSMEHVNGPPIVSKNWHVNWEYGSFETTVGTMLIPTEDTVGFTHCQPTADMKDLSGYIIGVPATLGCSPEHVARNYKEVGAKGMITLSGFPIGGLTSLYWNGLNNDDVIDFPHITIGGFSKFYLTKEYKAGNETVVAIAPGDVNLHLKAAWEPLAFFQWLIGIFGAVALLVSTAYIRKLMYDLAPANKKWERTMATSCIELEFVLTLFKFPYITSYGGYRHLYTSWFFIGPHASMSYDLENFTTIILVIYFFKMTSNNKLTKGGFTKGMFCIAVLAVIPGAFANFLNGYGYVIFYWKANQDVFKALGITAINSPRLAALFKGWFALIFAVVYIFSGVKFLAYLRKSSNLVSGGAGSKDDPRVKMQRRMMSTMFASAVAMIAFGVVSVYTGDVSNPVISKMAYFTPAGTELLVFYVMDFGLLVSATQVYAFSGPVLRKRREMLSKKGNTTDVSASSTSSSAASSSYDSSSASSSSAASTSSGVSSTGVSSKM